MKVDTQCLLEQLATLEWFTNVGRPMGSANVLAVGSWKDAIGHCKTKRYANIVLESKNILTERLHSEARQRYQLWNKIVQEVKDVSIPLVAKKTFAVMKENKLPKVFKDQADWDVLAACMELEYSDLVPPRFAMERMQWYLAGHFPCGWEGDFPEGRLIVF